MNKDELDSIIKYNEHAVFMSEIALEVLKGNKLILDLKGVKELIAMYLLIPYITKDQLDKPSMNHNLPQLDINKIFQNSIDSEGNKCDITLDNLRNAICHSFVTIEDREEGYIIIDDRAIYTNRASHSNQIKKSLCQRIHIESAKAKLLELHNDVIDQQKSFNVQLKKNNIISL
ncbi:MAG: hypothetical protein IJ545_00765 [Alphaproteobacteria bacterium]|nr:hypothetical protein [Alphaproteobacteria bacterium]